LNEKELFSDYEPKTTPDTVHDYLRNPDSFVFKILDEIAQPNLKNLIKIMNYFIKYKKEAENSIGDYQEGNIALGADPDQYYPSEEEILVSELGKMIKSIIDSNSRKDIDNIKKKDGIKSQILIFNEIYFRHVDVMGSGRFFYAEKKKSATELRI